MGQSQHKLTRSGHVHFVESIVGWNYDPRATVTAGEDARAGEDTRAGEAAAGEERISRAITNRVGHSINAAPIPAQLPVDISPINDASDEQQPQPPRSPINDAAADDEQLQPLPVIAPVNRAQHSQQPQRVPTVPLNRAQQRQLRSLRDNLIPAVNDTAPAAQVTDEMLLSHRPQLRTGPRQEHYYGSLHTTQQTSDDEESLTYQQLMNSPHRDDWLAAVRNELNSLMKARTWRFVKKPAAANLVGCKWIFKIKRDKDGNINRFKARLVARGFTQVYGVHYAETYAPVARYSSIRLIIALAAHYNWELHQISTTPIFYYDNAVSPHQQ